MGIWDDCNKMSRYTTSELHGLFHIDKKGTLENIYFILVNKEETQANWSRNMDEVSSYKKLHCAITAQCNLYITLHNIMKWVYLITKVILKIVLVSKSLEGDFFFGETGRYGHLPT